MMCKVTPAYGIATNRNIFTDPCSLHSETCKITKVSQRQCYQFSNKITGLRCFPVVFVQCPSREGTVLARMLSEFQLPNGVTWFTFALLLMFIAFFRFNRVWSLRNWDIVLVFLISPGLILVNWAERLLAKQVGPTEIAELNQARFLGYTWLFVTTFIARGSLLC